MRVISCICLLLLLAACSSNHAEISQVQAKVDSLQLALNNTYRPGLGEFMSGIQVHHAKLYFAGINSNWELADFEINEIKEALDDIGTYCTDRPEVRDIGMIRPAIDSVGLSIQRRDLVQFKESYSLLTSTCNNCHRATNHAFNVIVTPTAPPVTNQDFMGQKK